MVTSQLISLVTITDEAAVGVSAKLRARLLRLLTFVDVFAQRSVVVVNFVSLLAFAHEPDVETKQ